MSEALTQALREETHLPKALSYPDGKYSDGKKSITRTKSSSPTGSEGCDRPPKKAKTNGSEHRPVSQVMWPRSHFIGSFLTLKIARLQRIRIAWPIW